MRSKEQIDGIVAALEAEYPDADCTLEERDPWKLLVQVRLAAQCTDERVNKVTPALFARYPDCAAMAEAEIPEVEEYIRSCGFYHGKARDLVLQARQLTDVFGGRVPDNMDDLLTLAGVAMMRYIVAGRLRLMSLLLIAIGLSFMLVEFFQHITFGTPMFVWSLYCVSVVCLIGVFLLIASFVPPLRAYLRRKFFF